NLYSKFYFFFFFQAEDGIRDRNVTGVQTCALSDLVIILPYNSRSIRKCLVNLPGPANCFISFRGLNGLSALSNCSSNKRSLSSRSEERRVGKECRSRWSKYHEKRKSITRR